MLLADHPIDFVLAVAFGQEADVNFEDDRDDDEAIESTLILSCLNYIYLALGSNIDCMPFSSYVPTIRFVFSCIEPQ